jgi:hypothetical protein
MMHVDDMDDGAHLVQVVEHLLALPAGFETVQQQCACTHQD